MDKLIIAAAVFAMGSFFSIPSFGQSMAPPHDMLFLNSWTYEKMTAVEKHSVTSEFEVIFKDSTVLRSTGKIDEYRNRFFFAINTRESARSITPNETLSLSKIYKNGEVLRGIAADSCWMFKSYSGRITVYSCLATQRTIEPLVSGIQLGDETQIMDLNQENVLKLTKDASAKVKALIESKKLLKAVLLYNKENQ
jgi:hypothetical protein